MTLEQVKEHFKYAKEVRSLSSGNLYDLNNMSTRGFHKLDCNIWFDDIKANNSCLVYDGYENKLAPILTYIFERGEEVEVSNDGVGWCDGWFFIGFTKIGIPVVETGYGYTFNVNRIRKLQPETSLEPELSQLKKKAEANGMTVNINININ